MKRGQEGLLRVLETQNEQQLQLSRDIKELASYFDTVVDLVNNVVEVQGKMKEYVTSHDREDELGNTSTNSVAVDGKLS